MNKSKILTSLALAGVLTAGVLGANVNAASGKQVGLYSGILPKRIIAAYNVTGADGKITAEDLKADFNAVSGVTGDVTTGANFTADGKDYTLAVYGDVNGNNKINTGDVIAIQQIIAGSKEATDLEAFAADLSGNKKVDTGDVLRVQRYIAGIVTTPEVKPVESEEPDPEEMDYTISFNDGTNVVNNQNVDSSTIVVKPSTVLTKDARKALIDAEEKYKLQLKVRVTGIDINDENSEKEIEAAELDLSNNDALLNKTEYEFNCANLATLANGDATVELYYEEDNDTATPTEVVVGTATLKINVVDPLVATNISVRRDSTREATIASVEGTDLAKIYYIFGGANDEYEGIVFNEDEDKVAFVTGDQTFAQGAEGVIATIAKNIDAADDLEDKAYTLYYVVEDVDGNRSGVLSTMVPKFGAEEVADVVIVTPTLDADSEDVKFTWNKDVDGEEIPVNGQNAKTFTVNVYKDGKAIATLTNYNQKTIDLSNFEYDNPNPENNKNIITDKDKGGAGEYSISVKINATEDTLESGVVTSGTVTVGGLKPVTIKSIEKADDFDNAANVDEYHMVTITWTDSNAKADLANDGAYTVELVYIDKDGEEHPTDPIEPIEKTDATNKRAKVKLTEANVLYYAKIVAKSANPLFIADSEEVETEAMFRLAVDAEVDDDLVESTKVTLNVTPVILNGKSTDYKFVFYKENDDHELVEDTSVNVTLVKTDDQEYVVELTGLEPNTDYYGKLVATVDNETGKSNIIEWTTCATYPDFTNYLTVTKVKFDSDDSEEDALKANSSNKMIIVTVDGKQVDNIQDILAIAINGEIYKAEDIFAHDGIDFGTNDDESLNEKFLANVEIANALADGDKFKVEDKAITIQLAKNEEAIDLGDQEGKDVTILGNKNIKATLTVAAKTLTLGGQTGSIFDTAAATATSKIVVKNGVEVTNAHDDLTVEAGASVVINTITFAATDEVSVTVANNEITIPKDSTATVNGIAIETGDNKSVVATVTSVDSEKNVVTDLVLQANETVKVNNVTFKDIKVNQNLRIDNSKDAKDVNNEKIDKNVIQGIKVVTTDESPNVVNLTGIEVKKWVVSDDDTLPNNLKFINKKYIGGVEANTIVDDEDDGNEETIEYTADEKWTSVKSYIESYKTIYGHGATLTVNKDNKNATFTVPSTETVTFDFTKLDYELN